MTPLTKNQIVEPLLEHRGDAVVVTTMGIVRPWGAVSRSELDFASADSAMGHAADLALGIALAQPRRRVICLNGDGSMLMTLGTFVTAVQAKARNFVLFVLCNGTYEITGNQPIPGAGRVDFVALARGAGFEQAHRVENPEGYRHRLVEWLETPGPVLVQVPTVAGTEPPLSRGNERECPYLRPSLAESARRLRSELSAPGAG